MNPGPVRGVHGRLAKGPGDEVLGGPAGFLTGGQGADECHQRQGGDRVEEVDADHALGAAADAMHLIERRRRSAPSASDVTSCSRPLDRVSDQESAHSRASDPRNCRS